MISRTVIVPRTPATAFTAWTNAEQITSWWGDDTSYRTTAWQADPTPGGAWHATFATPDGQTFSASGTYTAVDQPSVLDWTWSSEWDPSSIKQIAMRFAAEGTKTRLTITTTGHANDDEAREDERGWDQILAWFIAKFETGS